MAQDRVWGTSKALIGCTEFPTVMRFGSLLSCRIHHGIKLVAEVWWGLGRSAGATTSLGLHGPLQLDTLLQ